MSADVDRSTSVRPCRRRINATAAGGVPARPRRGLRPLDSASRPAAAEARARRGQDWIGRVAARAASSGPVEPAGEAPHAPVAAAAEQSRDDNAAVRKARDLRPPGAAGAEAEAPRSESTSGAAENRRERPPTVDVIAAAPSRAASPARAAVRGIGMAAVAAYGRTRARDEVFLAVRGRKRRRAQREAENRREPASWQTMTSGAGARHRHGLPATRGQAGVQPTP